MRRHELGYRPGTQRMQAKLNTAEAVTDVRLTDYPRCHQLCSPAARLATLHQRRQCRPDRHQAVPGYRPRRLFRKKHTVPSAADRDRHWIPGLLPHFHNGAAQAPHPPVGRRHQRGNMAHIRGRRASVDTAGPRSIEVDPGSHAGCRCTVSVLGLPRAHLASAYSHPAACKQTLTSTLLPPHPQRGYVWMAARPARKTRQ